VKRHDSWLPAAALSALLHALLGFVLWRFAPAAVPLPPASRPLQVVLLGASSGRASAATAPHADAPHQMEPPPAAAKAPGAAPETRARKPVEKTRAPTRTTKTPPAPTAPGADLAAREQPAAATATPGTGPALAAATPPSGGGTDGIVAKPGAAGPMDAAPLPDAERAAYLAYLRSRLQETLQYPRQAERLGLTGEVRVRFSIDADGRLIAGSLQILSSSGHPLLDAGAEATVTAAAPFRKPPQPMTVDVPVGFRNTATVRR
jgi:protein TonB